MSILQSYKQTLRLTSSQVIDWYSGFPQDLSWQLTSYDFALYLTAGRTPKQMIQTLKCTGWIQGYR